uniref:Terminase n=1 Tax=viral metagenome TaxID=1070528 RepID=A0A6M3XHP6_9ZZZZ
MSGETHLEVRKKEIDNVLAEYLPKLTPKQQQAVKQIAVTDKLPKTKVEWAKFFGISRPVLYTWLCQRNFIECFQTINRLTQSLYVPQVIINVKRRTTRSDVASRLFLEYTGALQSIQTQPAVTNTVNIAFISTNRDKIKQIADQLAFDSLADPKLSDEVIEGQIEV